MSLYIVVAIASVLLNIVLVGGFYALVIRKRRALHDLNTVLMQKEQELLREIDRNNNLFSRVITEVRPDVSVLSNKTETQKFKMVTVLFADIEGFTQIVDTMNPESLIDELDRFFLKFDAVVQHYNIEKIKTIGDAYMCAGGIPIKNRTNPVEVVLAALQMNAFMKDLQANKGQEVWSLRIGIDTGPVIAGTIGSLKPSYDIWGTTVNVASRMESSSDGGKINITGNTFLFVKEYFNCKYRGKMPVKNRGDIDMYFVEGIIPHFSHPTCLFLPNNAFVVQLQLLRLGDLEEFVLDMLEKGLPKNLYYHNLKHTVDVYTQVELIGKAEGLSDEELLLIRTAALLHDAGHLVDYDYHEEMGVKLAKEILPKYLYSSQQIEIISKTIMATKMPPKPQNLYERIICDADLDYLGRMDFLPVSNNLFKELQEHGRINSMADWNGMQVKFIEKHQYFTNTAQKLRNVNKNIQLEKIKSVIITGVT
ncbi:Adenylate cyclase, class 3 [Williamwhitmania taraxaci]|uniref:Adenylate cyclase, class 3 n=2 Tax=Williamwhitmania taraxaci TaxID=1640674 RepID=A0A1G6P0C7_9BACT|nr:Adenylate cyclase, class 3 [Williamwhitmania taraxaci]